MAREKPREFGGTLVDEGETMALHRALILAFSFVFLSCLPGAKSPTPAADRTLDLAGEPAELTASAPFGVVFAAPKGETSEVAQVSLLFNRPMRALDAAGSEAPSPAKITIAGGAAPEGEWRWLGSNGLVFVPKKQLPRATEYVVTVPAGTRALDGSVLGVAYELRFSTPVPKVLSSDLYGEHVKPDATFSVSFDQPIALAEVRAHLAFSVGGKKQGARVELEDPKDPLHFKVTPLARLPLDTPIELSVDEKIRGVEGPLPSGKPYLQKGRTYGPLKAASASCSERTPGKCAPGSSLNLVFSNDVSSKELLAHARIDGVGALQEGWPSESEYHTVFSDKLAAGRSYRLVVSAGLKDIYGQTLPKDFAWSFTLDDEWPMVALGVSGEVLEAVSTGFKTQPIEIPVTQVNLASYKTVVAPIDEATYRSFWENRTRSFATLAAIPGARVETVTPTSPRNVSSTKRVSLTPGLPAGRGAVAIGIRWGTQAENTRVLQVTDLAISAKMSPFGGLVWVTHLSDGKPVAGATVAIRSKSGATVASAPTDADGVAALPSYKASPGSEDFLVVQKGVDVAYKRVAELIYSFDVSTDYEGKLRPFGMVFTERGIYRPGETIHAKALVRQETEKGTSTPKGREVSVVATDATGEKLLERKARLGDFGECAFDVPIPRTAPLGGVYIQVQDDETSIGTSATVAEYRPAEFKVSVEPARPAYIRGDKLEVSARADYLFGAPMSGGKVRLTATRAPGYFAVPGHEDFITRDDAYAADLADGNLRAQEVLSARASLGPKGDFATSASLALPAQHATETVSIEAEVEDLSRQAIASSASVLVHPGEFYVGLEPLADGFLTAGDKIKPRVVAVDPSGKRRESVKVRVQLLARTWQSVLRATGTSGATYDSRAVDVEVGACEVTTASSPQSCELQASKSAYYILRASAKDARGNAVAASTSLYAVSDDAVYGWPMSDARKVELVLDKKAYAIGDTAKLLVKNPWPGAEAIVTVERAGVLSERRVQLKGSMPTLTFPVTEEMRPNAFLSVRLVRGRAKDAPAIGADVDVGAPSFRVGTAELRVDPELRRLKVKVTPLKLEYHPGEEVEADVAITDRAGKPVRAELTFFAVDEGVLMLTGYKTPDPIPAFTQPRPLSVFNVESREDLAKLIKARVTGGEDKGLDGGGGGNGSAREDFRTTAYFAPHLVAEGGKAHVKFKLPDSLTTYRLMAVAASEDDRFGSADAQITSSRKLMARPALPRFLRAGDAISAGVIVSTKNFTEPAVDVELDAQGITIAGDAKRTISIPASGSVEVKFDLKAERVGDATLVFKVRGGGESDAVKVTRKIQVPTVIESVAVYGETESAITERLGQITGVRNDYGGLDVRMASTALVGLDDGFDALVEYPYGCTEQLTSRLVPLMVARDLAKEFGVSLPKDVDPKVDDAIAKVLANQLSNGGFGYWRESPRAYAWLTAYALWGMTVAKDTGHNVPSSAIEGAHRFLRAWLQSGNVTKRMDAGDLHPHELGLAERAFVLDVLAMTGKPDPGYTDSLWEKRAELPVFARAMLAHAMVLSKMDLNRARELLQGLDNAVRQTGQGAIVSADTTRAYEGMLDSDARSTALVLRAIAAADPKHPMATKLARGLLGMRKHGAWRSTQENAWALLALRDYHKAAEGPLPDFDVKVLFGEKQVASVGFHQTSLRSSSLHVDKTSSGASLGFELTGQGKLFYQARLKYARSSMPDKPLDRGFFVKKVMRALRAEDLSRVLSEREETGVSKARGGDLVLVDLYVTTSEPREQVVIEDPLPAGLEPIDAALATSARTLDVAPEAEDDDSRFEPWWTRAWSRRELRDDRVLTFLEHMPAGMYHYRYLARATTFGTFVVPPTKAECMYEPEIFGRTAGSTFEVAQ